MNSKTEFKDFVERQKRKSVENPPIDWTFERDEWLSKLNELYERIADYLHEYIENGDIELIDEEIELNEENIGSYKAVRKIVKIGPQIISLTPIGTLLIGSKGRVDVEGSAGRSRLILIDKEATNARQMIRVTTASTSPGKINLNIGAPANRTDIEWVWKIVSRPPEMRFSELNKDSFLDLLMEISNG